MTDTDIIVCAACGAPNVLTAEQLNAIEAEARATATPGLDVERLARALDAHMADFIEQPESFENSALVAANIARHYRRAALSASGADR